MTEEEVNKIMKVTVALVCNQLSDQELATLNLVGQLDQDPKNRIFDYEKVKCLFTENKGKTMHEVTKDALARIVMLRLVEK